MDALIKAVRTVLTSDPTLTDLVPADDITSSYNAESANYPCVVLSITSGGSFTEIPGVTRATLVVDIYVSTDKLDAWEIYDRIKALLHNQGRSISDASTLVHIIYETRVDDSRYDATSDVWQITVRFEIIFSTTSVLAMAIEDGGIYAHDTDVQAEDGGKVGDFNGILSLDVAFLRREKTESKRFTKSLYFHRGIAFIDIESVAFRPETLELLFSVTYDGSDYLRDDTTEATSYTITQDTTPSFLQFLFQGVKTVDGKKIEILALNAAVESLQIPFSTSELSRHRCRWTCLGDASGNVVKVSLET